MGSVISINPNAKAPKHFNVECNPGKFTLVLSDVTKEEGKDVVLTETGCINIAAKDAEDAIYVSRHLRWELSKLIEAMKSRKAEVDKALYQEPVKVEEPAQVDELAG